VKKIYAAGEPHPGRVTNAVDVHGRTLLPGLIDAHGHVMSLGLQAIQLDLSGSSSLSELQQRLEDYATANPNTPWIQGRGWNQELWPDKRFPTAADLDAAVRDRPVWLVRVDGHAAVGNSLALKEAGVTVSTKSPTGGRIEKAENGRPTGVFVDAARELVESRIPAPSAPELDRALLKAQEILLASGLTTVTDTATSVDDWNAMRRLGDVGGLQIRVITYAFGPEPLRTIAPNGPTPWLFDDRLVMQGVKFYADGALGSRGAWLKQPYADKPDTRGLPQFETAQLLDQADQAAKSGSQVAIHAIGDATVAQVIGVFENLGRSYPGDRRWRIEHFQIADPADIPRLAPAGIIASMQPTHQTSDRLMAEKRLGPNRLAGAYAWQTVLKSGAKLAFGSDFPVESPNPFPGLAAAISRQDMDGQPPGGWIPSERLTFAQALSAFTRDAAYAGYADTRIGALEPGKWADFILVDRDPTGVDAQALARMQVLETWVGGQKVWERAPSASATERGR
jgi:predicted amidohydrolase YtcJ